MRLIRMLFLWHGWPFTGVTRAFRPEITEKQKKDSEALREQELKNHKELNSGRKEPGITLAAWG